MNGTEPSGCPHFKMKCNYYFIPCTEINSMCELWETKYKAFKWSYKPKTALKSKVLIKERRYHKENEKTNHRLEIIYVTYNQKNLVSVIQKEPPLINKK